MARRDGLKFDVSVSGAKKRAARRRGMTGEVGSSTRKCEWEGCEAPGLYRAPHSREKLDSFRWFCLDHVREYNARWNYYAEMSDDEVAENMRLDQVWGRPTWKFGKPPPGADPSGPHADGQAWRRFGLEDPMELLGEKGTLNPGARDEAKRARARLLPQTVRRALQIMQLDPLTTKTEIRTRYKELVKRFHPDQNGGDRSEEARLRDVLWAWDQLKNNDAFGD